MRLIPNPINRDLESPKPYVGATYVNCDYTETFIITRIPNPTVGTPDFEYLRFDADGYPLGMNKARFTYPFTHGWKYLGKTTAAFTFVPKDKD